MAEASLALLAPARGRNLPLPQAATLYHEWSAALSIWAALPPGSRKEPAVCRQLLELRDRLGVPASTMEAAHA
jgi:hypothetical protein